MTRIFLALISLLVFAPSMVAQANPKIAVVDIERFDDQSTGIKALTAASRLVYDADTVFVFAGPRLKRKIDDLGKEIAILDCQDTSRKTKLAQLEKLISDYADLKKADQEALKDREAMVYKPLLDQVRQKLQDYAAKKGYLLIIDKSSVLFASPVLVGDGVSDVTDDFIRYCNDSFASKKLD